MASQEWHYKVLRNLDQSHKWIHGTDIQYINGDMKTTLTYVSFFSKPIALGDKIWIVKLRYNGSVSLYSGCKHTFSYIIYFEKLKAFEIIIWNLKCNSTAYI